MDALATMHIVPVVFFVALTFGRGDADGGSVATTEEPSIATDEAFGELVIPAPTALMGRAATVGKTLPSAAVLLLGAGALARAGVDLHAPLRIVAVAPPYGENAISWGVILVPENASRLEAAALKLGWARRKIGAAYLVGPRIDRISDVTVNAALARPLTAAPTLRLLSGERAAPAWTAVAQAIGKDLDGFPRMIVTALAFGFWQTLIQMESLTLTLPDTGGDLTLELEMVARPGSKLAAWFDGWRPASFALVAPVGQMDVLIAGRLDAIAGDALELLPLGHFLGARNDEASLRKALQALSRAGASEIAVGMGRGRVHWVADGAAKQLAEGWLALLRWAISLSGEKGTAATYAHEGFVARQVASPKTVGLAGVRGSRAAGSVGATEEQARADFRAALDATHTLGALRRDLIDAARARGEALVVIVDNSRLDPGQPGPLLEASLGRQAPGTFRIRVALATGPLQRFLRTFLQPNPAVLFAEDGARQVCACPTVDCTRQVLESLRVVFEAKFTAATGTQADVARISMANGRMTACAYVLSALPPTP